MLEQVKQIFAPYIVGDHLVTPTGFGLVDDFVSLFADVKDYSYSEFIRVDGYIDEQHIGKGYRQFFDQCKSEGILL